MENGVRFTYTRLNCVRSGVCFMVRYLFVIIYVVLFGCSSGLATPLGASISTDSKRYHLSGAITLRAELRNSSTHNICLYSDLGWGSLGGLQLQIESSGVKIFPKEYDHDMVVPANLAKASHYSCIFPHQFIGKYRTDVVADLFPEAGTYQIWLEYKSPVSLRGSIVKDHFFSREEALVISDKIEVIIEP